VHLSTAASAEIIGELRRTRRRQRVASIHWIDALYQVYVTGLFSVIGIVLVSGAIGDGALSPSAVDEVRDLGPAAMGLLVAFAVLMGLRSGSHGGPLALEKADVRHVLLAPVDRGVALRGPAWRQLRFLVAVGAAVGAVAGQLAVRRLPGNAAEWILMGALFGVTVVGLGYGSALVASGTTMRTWMADVIGLALLTWGVADLLGNAPTAPSSYVGELAVAPLALEPVAFVGVVLAVALVLAGMRTVAGTSLEAAERRTALVGQMRFAVTLQDLRTVMVLRRQLAQEHPRARPWIRARRRRPRYPIWHRGVRSVLRWPVSRIVRFVALGVVAGLALRGVWQGTTPLLVVVGLALWIAALDGAEPLGQEIDHPGRTDAFPMPRGEVFVRHLPLVAVVGAKVGLLAAIVAAVPLGTPIPWGPALVTGLFAGLLAAAGAAVSVVQGAPDPVDTVAMAQPEIAGIRTVYRTALPPVLAILGATPVLAARAAAEGASDPPPLAAAMNIAVLLVIPMVLVVGWIRFRDQIKAAMAEAIDNASPTKIAERQRNERLEAEAAEAEAEAAEAEAQGKAQSNAPRPKAGKRPPKADATPRPSPQQRAKMPVGRKRDQR
jgi:hypothetical protein